MDNQVLLYSTENDKKNKKGIMLLLWLYSENRITKPGWQHISLQHGLLNILSPVLRPIAQKRRKRYLSKYYYSIKLPMAFFTDLNKKNLKIFMETKRTPNSQSNLEGKKQSWRDQTPWLQTILQSYNNQDTMVLVQKQKYRSMEQDKKPRDKPTHLWSTNLWQRRQGYTMEKRQSLQ